MLMLILELLREWAGFEGVLRDAVAVVGVAGTLSEVELVGVVGLVGLLGALLFVLVPDRIAPMAVRARMLSTRRGEK